MMGKQHTLRYIITMLKIDKILGGANTTAADIAVFPR